MQTHTQYIHASMWCGGGAWGAGVKAIQPISGRVLLGGEGEVEAEKMAEVMGEEGRQTG